MNEAHPVRNQNRAAPDMSYSALHCESLLKLCNRSLPLPAGGAGGRGLTEATTFMLCRRKINLLLSDFSLA